MPSLHRESVAEALRAGDGLTAWKRRLAPWVTVSACSFQCSGKLSASPLSGEDAANPVPFKERSPLLPGTGRGPAEPGHDRGPKPQPPLDSQELGLRSSGSDLRGRPIKPARPACLPPEISLRLRPAARPRRGSRGQPCLLTSHEQSGSCLMQKQAPLSKRVFLNSDSRSPPAHLSPIF